MRFLHSLSLGRNDKRENPFAPYVVAKIIFNNNRLAQRALQRAFHTPLVQWIFLTWFLAHFTAAYMPLFHGEQGILKTAQCAVLPCEVSERIFPARTVTECGVILTPHKKSLSP